MWYNSFLHITPTATISLLSGDVIVTVIVTHLVWSL